MSMNVNRFFKPQQPPKGWQDGTKPTPGYNPQELKPEPTKSNGGRIEVKPQSNQHNVSSEELQNLLNAIDNPNIPNFG